jgi:RNA polymerase sigma-70 factor (ECF subfamily)
MRDGCVHPTPETPAGGTFDEVVLPHLAAARRLAHWMLRNEHDAEDALQEASLRALRYFRTFSGGNGRAWFLRIVRNTCHGWRANGRHLQTDPFDEERHALDRPTRDPEALVLQTDDVRLLDAAMRAMPEHHRALLVLRELEGLSYRELADAMGVPIGTVMSGLSRGRRALRKALDDQLTSRERTSRQHDARRDSRRSVPSRATTHPEYPRASAG